MTHDPMTQKIHENQTTPRPWVGSMGVTLPRDFADLLGPQDFAHLHQRVENFAEMHICPNFFAARCARARAPTDLRLRLASAIVTV